MLSPSTPRKRRHNVIAGHPPSPLALKRQRLSVSASDTADPSPEPQTGNHNTRAVTDVDEILYSFQDPEDDNKSKAALSCVQVTDLTIGDSIAVMDLETHRNRLATRDRIICDKGTGDAYPRHVRSYQKFMAQDQAMRVQANPFWKVIDAHPITATKVAAFLEYETTRPKQTSDGKDIPGTRLGPDAIKQCVSALESYRYHHKGSDPRYKSDPEAQQPLRNDERITTYEKSAYATEPERLAESQVLKAKGVTSDTYTEDELSRASVSLLQSSHKTIHQVHLSLRDRAMLLVSTSTAYRGDNLRRLLLSDLGFRFVPMVDVSLDTRVMAAIFRSNEGKTNTTGRIDEQGTFRHRAPELCAVGALGFYLFSQYHLVTTDVPRFEPDFTHPQAGEFGYREWYTTLLFPGAKGKEMTYENHNKRMTAIKKLNNIETTKVTHGGRAFFALYTREHGANKDETKHGGAWNCSDAFGKSYDRALPVEALLAASGFNGKKQESYFIARDQLKPSTALCKSLFSWVEPELAALEGRNHAFGKAALDKTLHSFLNLLKLLRVVILQDAAVLSIKYPHCPLWRHAPFSLPEFRVFAAAASSVIHRAEEEACHRLKNLPEAVAASFRGMVTTACLQQEKTRNEIHEDNARLSAKLQNIEEQLGTILDSTSKVPKQRKAKQKAHAATTTPSLSQPPAEIFTPPPLPLIVPSAPPPHPHPDDLPDELSVDPDSSQNIYPARTFPISQDPTTRDAQLAFIANLESKFSRDRLAKHQFEWIISSRRSQGNEFLPRYTFWTPKGQNVYPSVREIWSEYKFGMDGHLSISELNAGWDARWRSQGPARTEMSRRNKIIGLIEDLSKNSNWRPDLALQYLETKYPIPTHTIPYLRTTRAFIDRLQKQDKELRTEILEGSKTFCS
ncbi:hypothetical protein D9615_004052 [Tricholomella constricta]|uniref:Uncharacterized protein n=1 Tax=Tricholomella constricta TaxID=117010 RepID=A0A8H5M4L6_9AGAR|nr:hypothetical protein D9615_004053 [Tricholomella constricta]KAF5381021.1 hypothetical protein D9615_004052 [Tricholomella constricta]